MTSRDPKNQADISLVWHDVSVLNADSAGSSARNTSPIWRVLWQHIHYLATRRRRGHLWIVTSANRLAIIRIVRGQETVLWLATSPYQPALSRRRAELWWQDRSRMTFVWPHVERKLLCAHTGEGVANVCASLARSRMWATNDAPGQYDSVLATQPDSRCET